MSPRGRKGTPPEDPADLAPVPSWAFVREFRKNRKTGQIWAIELVNGVLNGALECSKPEELTDGALPVLPLDPARVDEYRQSADQCDAWQPPSTPDGIRRNLVTAGHRLDDLETKIGKAKQGLKRLNEQRDEVVAQIRRYVRDLETGQANLLDKMATPATEEAPAAAEDSPAAEDGTDAPAADVAEGEATPADERSSSGTTENYDGEAGDHVP